MNIIKWKEETSNPDYPRFTAFINNKTVAFASFVPLSKNNKFYSYHHSLIKELNVEASKDFATIEKCKEYTQKAFDQLLDYAKTRKLVWHYPNSNKKQSYLIFEHTNFALACVDLVVADLEDTDDDFTSVGVDLYQGYLFLYSVDDVIYNESYEKLKSDISERIQKALNLI